MKTILVTGGAGFIGSHLCEKLLKDNFVVCVDNFDSYYNPKIKEDNVKNILKNRYFKLYKIDILDKQKLSRIFSKHNINKIVHLAARTGIRASFEDPRFYNEVNVTGTLNLLELANKFRINNFIFGSSSSVYGVNNKFPFSENDALNDIVSPYAISKRNSELYCELYSKLYNLNVTCLRFFAVYGPRSRPDLVIYKFTDKIIKREFIEIYGDGNSKRDYTFIDDIINGILLALNKDFRFEIINLGNSNPIKLNYVISLIEKELCKKAKIKKLSNQKGDAPITYADISKAKKILVWKPEIKLEEGIKKFIEWYKKKNYKKRKTIK